MTTHGYKKHPYYQRWINMNDRCANPNHAQFHDYGGRGITICPAWSKEAGPVDFCDWIEANLGPCPEGMTLDRYPNNDGHYEPGNVRWATRQQQLDNRRLNKPRRKNSNLPTGVRPRGKRFLAQITVGAERVYLGTYDTPEEASDIFQFAKRQLKLYRRELFAAPEPTKSQK